MLFWFRSRSLRHYAQRTPSVIFRRRGEQQWMLNWQNRQHARRISFKYGRSGRYTIFIHAPAVLTYHSRGDISATEKKAYIAAVLCKTHENATYTEANDNRSHPEAIQAARCSISRCEVSIR